MSEIRLQVFLSRAGVSSRREAEKIIEQGRVAVNGKPVTEMGAKVSPDDVVLVDGRQVFIEEQKVYVALNKPTGYVTTAKDQFGRPTVLDLVKDIPERIYPVGRLDYDTSGLIFLTNDGDFAYRLTHPSHEISKTYIAKIEGTLSEEEKISLQNGVKIEDYTTAHATVKVIEQSRLNSLVEIAIHEGRNRQVRKMFEAVGRTVLKLRRIKIGKVTLDGIKPGSWRHLTQEEVNMLMR